MKKIEDHKDLKQKIVLLRVDLNVPIKNNKIIDDNRIVKVLPMIKYLNGKVSKIIIISHIGRPKGKINSNLSLAPICNYLIKELNTEIRLI